MIITRRQSGIRYSEHRHCPIYVSTDLTVEVCVIKLNELTLWTLECTSSFCKQQ